MKQPATMQPDISIIVPVYNSMKYLPQCIESLLNQTHQFIEVVCVDDGSTDGSGALLDELAAIDKRIIVAHKENGGAASARNKGLELATGKYIMFVDSDDFITYDACSMLLSTATKHKADIVVFGGKTFPTVSWADNRFSKKNKVYKHDSITALFEESSSLPLMCNKMYSTDLLKSNNLSFNTNLEFGEDHAFQVVVFPYASTIAYIKDRLYFYREHPGSLVSSNQSDIEAYKRLNMHLEVVKFAIENWEERGIDEGNETSLYVWAIDFLFKDILKTTFNNRKLFAQKFADFFDPRLNALEEAEIELENVTKRRVEICEIAKDIPHIIPKLTFILDTLDGSLDIEDSLKCLTSQDEQNIEFLVIPPVVNDLVYKQIIETVASSDQRFRFAETRDVRTIVEEIRSGYFMYFPLNIVLDSSFAWTYTETARRIDNRKDRNGHMKGPQMISFGDTQGVVTTKDVFDLIEMTPNMNLGTYPVVSADALVSHCFDHSGIFPGNSIMKTSFAKALFDERDIHTFLELTCTGYVFGQKLYIMNRHEITYSGLSFQNEKTAQSYIESFVAESENASKLVNSEPHASSFQCSLIASKAMRALAYLRILKSRDDFLLAHKALKQYLNECVASGISTNAEFIPEDFETLFRQSMKLDPDDYRDLVIATVIEAITGNVIEYSSTLTLWGAHLSKERQTNRKSKKQIAELETELDNLKNTWTWQVGHYVTAPPRAMKRYRKTVKRRKKTRANEKANVLNDAPKVSIVVPVYNTSRYLRQCLDSLISQTLSDIEIICVNDGSTDDSPNILEEYRERDSRISVISKANGGYGETMNRGLAAARGEYIGIVESDDYVDEAMFERYYELAKSRKLDLVKSNYYEHSDAGDELQEVFRDFEYEKVYNPAKKQELLMVLPSIWSALYKRELLEANRISFNESPGASYQDTSFVFQVWTCAKRVALIEEGFLHYRVDNESSSVKSEAKVFAVNDEYAFSEEFLKSRDGLFEIFGPVFTRLKLGTYRWNYGRISPEYRQAFAEQMSREFRQAEQDGCLDPNFYTDSDWFLVKLLMSNPEAFCEKHPEKF